MQTANSKYGVMLTGSFRPEPLVEPLNEWFREIKVCGCVKCLPYRQVFQQMLDPEGELRCNAGGLNVVLLRLEDLTGMRPDGDGLTDHAVREASNELLRVSTVVSNSGGCDYLIYLCPSSPEFAEAAGAPILAAIEGDIVRQLHSLPGIYAMHGANVVARYDVTEFHDHFCAKHADLPYKQIFYAALSCDIARHIYLLTRPSPKVVVLDCDNTLWGGNCGENVAGRVEIDPQRQALQEFMAGRQRDGILLCLCSKNSEADVVRAFQQKDMILTYDDFISKRINWSPKSENIKSIAEEIGVETRSMVFIDDDLAECHEVQFGCPEVTVVRLPEPALIPRFLKHFWILDRLKVTDDDAARVGRYKSDVRRKQISQRSITLDEFLKSLDLIVSISEAAAQQYERIAELTTRTTQFNANSRRKSSAELVAMRQAGYQCLAVEARDRFGDYGLVGVLQFRVLEEMMEVETFLLSCRALGRNIEQRMLQELIDRAARFALEHLEIDVVRTERNVPFMTFLEKANVGVFESTSEAMRYRINLQATGDLPSNGLCRGCYERGDK